MNLIGGRWWRWRGFGSPRDASHLSLLEVSKLVSGCRVNCLVCLHESRAGLLRWRSATISNFAQLWFITQRQQRQCTQLIFSELKVWHSRCHMSFLQIRVYVRVRPLNSKEDRFLKQQYSYHVLLDRIVTYWSSKYILLSSEDLAHVRDSIAVDTVLGTVGGQDMTIRALHRGGWGIDLLEKRDDKVHFAEPPRNFAFDGVLGEPGTKLLGWPAGRYSGTENTPFTFAAFCDYVNYVRSASQEDVFQLFGTNVAEACLSGSAPQGTLFEVDFLMCCFAWCYMQVQWKHLCIWSDWKWEDLHNAGCCGSGLKALSQNSKMHATTHLSERARFWSDAFLTLKESVQSMHHEDKRCGSPAT